MGGLGILLPSDMACFAYTASMLSSLPLQNDILGIQRDLIPQEVRNLVSNFVDSVFPTESELALNLSTETLRPQSKHQFFMAHVFFTAKREDILKHDYIARAPADIRRRFQLVLDSAAEKVASSWLFALPNAGMNQRMTPSEFQASVAFRLLMPQFPRGHQCQCTRCTVEMDIYGYHALICRGKQRFERHQTVRDALYDLATLARFNPVKDAPVRCLGRSASGTTQAFRPADLLISGDDFAQDCVDVTVVCPFSTVMTGGGALVIGKKVDEAEDNKFHKHQEACENASYGFKTFAIDVFGVVGSRSLGLLNRIRNAIVRATGQPSMKATAICYRKMSLAVQKGVARQVLAQFEPVSV